MLSVIYSYLSLPGSNKKCLSKIRIYYKNKDLLSIFSLMLKNSVFHCMDLIFLFDSFKYICNRKGTKIEQ